MNISKEDVDELDCILTNIQIECWRQVLRNILGDYALTMPKEEIQAIRDRMQNDEESQQQMLQTVLPEM